MVTFADRPLFDDTPGSMPAPPRAADKKFMISILSDPLFAEVSLSMPNPYPIDESVLAAALTFNSSHLDVFDVEGPNRALDSLDALLKATGDTLVIRLDDGLTD